MHPTTDLCDDHEASLTDGTLRVLPPVFQSWGLRAAFSGPIVTVRCHEDNTTLRLLLDTPGQGRVIFVDGGGSERRALLGGNLAKLAQDNGWAGLVIDGCIRDSEEIDACDIGVRALATVPVRPGKGTDGQTQVPVSVAGVRVAPGDWCYADADGVIVADRELR